MGKKGHRPKQSDLDAALLARHSNSALFNKRIKFKKARRPDNIATQQKLVPINGRKGARGAKANGVSTSAAPIDDDNELPTPKHYLFPKSRLERMLVWPEVRAVGPGLYNLGNTCFMNSVLQAVMYTPPIAHFAMESDHRKTCRASGFCSLCYLIGIIQKAMGGTRSPIAPKAFFHNLRTFHRGFRPGQQADAHEFMRCFLDSLHKANVPGHKKLDRTVAQTAFFMQTHTGYLQSQVKCSVCGYESNTFDPFLDLSLEINKSQSVIAALRRFTHAETLDGENKYRCCRCDKKVKASKQFTVKQAPNILCLHLKRFAYGRGKLSHHVQFPETLSLKPYMSARSESPGDYELYATVVHLGGSMHSGHYYAFIKSSNGMWYHMDDSSVSQVGLGRVLKSQAYMVFYRRRPVVAVDKQRRLSHDGSRPSAKRARDGASAVHAPLSSSDTVQAAAGVVVPPAVDTGAHVDPTRTHPAKVKRANGTGLWIVESHDGSNGDDVFIPVPQEMNGKAKATTFRERRLSSGNGRRGSGTGTDPTVKAAAVPTANTVVAAATTSTPVARRRSSASEDTQMRARRDSVEAINSIFGSSRGREGSASLKKKGEKFDPRVHTKGRREMMGKNVPTWGEGDEGVDSALEGLLAERETVLRSKEFQTGGKRASKWDEFYDAGRVKKVKKKKREAKSTVNPFTQAQKLEQRRQLERRGFR